MRHRKQHAKLNRTSEHRKALHRNLAQSLFEHGQITTTMPKAKDLRPYAERLVTLAVKVRKAAAAGDAVGSLRARRRLEKVLGDRAIIPAEHRDDYWSMTDARRDKVMRTRSGRRHRTGEPKGRLAFTASSVLHHLIEQVAPRFEDRPGGYTRVIRLPDRRVGDHAPLAMIQLVGEEEAPGSLTKPAKSARQKRADARYRFAIKLTKAKKSSPPKDQPAPVADEPAPTEDEAAETDAADEAGDDETKAE